MEKEVETGHRKEYVQFLLASSTHTLYTTGHVYIRSAVPAYSRENGSGRLRRRNGQWQLQHKASYKAPTTQTFAAQQVRGKEESDTWSAQNGWVRGKVRGRKRDREKMKQVRTVRAVT